MNYIKDINQLEKTQLIASSKSNFSIELVESLGKETSLQIIKISEDLKKIYGPNSILTINNIHKYFNKNTLPFIARYNNEVIGFIIGTPLEYFQNQSWVQYDQNLGKKNTLYTYAFIFRKDYRKKSGFAKTLKKVYTNWAKKRNFLYISGHINKNNFKTNNKTDVIREFSSWYESKDPFIYYRKKI